MVDRDHRLECHGAVAVFADVACLQMGRTLASRATAVVATDAVANDA